VFGTYRQCDDFVKEHCWRHVEVEDKILHNNNNNVVSFTDNRQRIVLSDFGLGIVEWKHAGNDSKNRFPRFMSMKIQKDTQ